MLRLRPYTRQDAETVCRWFPDKKAFELWSAGKIQGFPLTPEMLNAYYDRNAGADLWAMTAFDEEGTAGHVMMRFLDEEKQELRLGLIVVDGGRRGRGYGREMVSQASRFAFDYAGAGRVTILVFLENYAAVRCYEACGFRRTPGKEPELYQCMGEEWHLAEMELRNTGNTEEKTESEYQ